MRISDTSAHFVIRNVSFVNGTGDEEALGLDGVRNGRIEQVRIEGARSGISSRSVGFGARDLVIDSVSIRDTRMGIEIQAPMNVSVLNSTFTNSSYEFLRLAYGGSAAVVGNHFANSVRSISLWELDALEFQSNVVDNVSRLELEDIGSGNVSSNHFNLSTNMYVQRSRGLNLTGNQFQGFPRAELSLEFSTGLRLASNTFDVGGIRILGQGREHFSTHNISSDNSVGAEPIVYRASCGNETHDADDFGQLFLVDCSYVRVQPGTVRDSAVAVTVAYSRDVRIAGLT
ncbi:MAG TPA: right-handed parallel beta-helix repeat-containing protein, partial [Candidatus Thermoplasmatota archaeon]